MRKESGRTADHPGMGGNSSAIRPAAFAFWPPAMITHPLKAVSHKNIRYLDIYSSRAWRGRGSVAIRAIIMPTQVDLTYLIDSRLRNSRALLRAVIGL